MITMYVTYAGTADTPFNREHWINVHLPLVRECWGPHGLERVSGFFPQGDGAGLIAIAPCIFRDEAAMTTARLSSICGRCRSNVSAWSFRSSTMKSS